MEGKIFCLRGYDKLHARLWRDTRMLVYSRSLWAHHYMFDFAPFSFTSPN